MRENPDWKLPPETRANILNEVEEWYWRNWGYSKMIGYHLSFSEDRAFRELKDILFPDGGGDVS